MRSLSSLLLGPTAAPLLASVLLVCPASPSLLAQGLRLSEAAGKPGDRVTLEISLNAPRELEPQALQWETTVPAARLSFADDPISAEAPVRAAGKSFACAPKAKAGETRAIVCILAGGVNTIPNGVIGRLQVRIPPGSPAGPAPVRIERGILLVKGLRQIPLPPIETVVKILSGSEEPDPAGK